MDYLYKSNCFNLKNTFENGQCFRWKDNNGVYQGVALNTFLQLKQCDDGVLFYNTDKETFDALWYNYFDCARDYNALQQKVAIDATMKAAVNAGWGMHILRQQPWEAFISFIISQNNNITRIKGIIERLCALCGTKITDGVYAFPAPEQLASVSQGQLEGIGAGYRAAYLTNAAKEVLDGKLCLEELTTCGYDNAKQRLLSVYGIGEKVANCVLLFGLGYVSAFPVDTWIRKAMSCLYTNGNTSTAVISKFAAEHFGADAGFAQQYIFYASRSGVINID